MRVTTGRLFALGSLVLLGLLYWHPLHTYVSTKHELDTGRAQVVQLRAQRAQLERRIAEVGSDAELVREGRRLDLVKPGERLFIVKGIPAWRKQH